MAGRVSQLRDDLRQILHDPCCNTILTHAEQRTGVDRLYIFFGVLGVSALWLVFGYAAQLFCNTIAIIYPAYASIKAIESRQKDDDTKWLTYWVVFAWFSVIEYFSDRIVSWFPFYWLVKCVFFIWLMVPTEVNGSIFLYEKVIKPFALKHHTLIDNTLNQVRESAHRLLEKKD